MRKTVMFSSSTNERSNSSSESIPAPTSTSELNLDTPHQQPSIGRTHGCRSLDPCSGDRPITAADLLAARASCATRGTRETTSPLTGQTTMPPSPAPVFPPFPPPRQEHHSASHVASPRPCIACLAEPAAQRVAQQACAAHSSEPPCLRRRYVRVDFLC